MKHLVGIVLLVCLVGFVACGDSTPGPEEQAQTEHPLNYQKLLDAERQLKHREADRDRMLEKFSPGSPVVVNIEREIGVLRAIVEKLKE